MAKAGYYDGDPEKVLNAPVDIIQGLLDYEAFELDYNDEYKALNKTK